MATRTINLVLAMLLVPALQNSLAAQQSQKPSAKKANGIPVSKSRMPKLYLMQKGVAHELPLDKTQLATTKNKPSSMKSLAGDSALTQAVQAGINTATWDAATHINSGVGGSAVQQAGSIFSGAISHRTCSRHSTTAFDLIVICQALKEVGGLDHIAVMTSWFLRARW